MTDPSDSDIVNGSGSRARYDDLAEWYDAYLQEPIYSNVPDYVMRLVGNGTGICIDAGCGTGIYMNALASLGWSVVGLDISSGQLRLANQRWSKVIQGDVARTPFLSKVASCVVTVLTLTDFDDVEPFFCEVERILIPGGRLAILTTHPCFVGPFVKMEGGANRVANIYPGYWTTRRVFEGPGIGNGLRSKVGVRHAPLSELFNKLTASKLALERVEEFGEGTIPWLLGLVAVKRDR